MLKLPPLKPSSLIKKKTLLDNMKFSVITTAKETLSVVWSSGIYCIAIIIPITTSPTLRLQQTAWHQDWVAFFTACIQPLHDNITFGQLDGLSLVFIPTADLDLGDPDSRVWGDCWEHPVHGIKNEQWLNWNRPSQYETIMTWFPYINQLHNVPCRYCWKIMFSSKCDVCL